MPLDVKTTRTITRTAQVQLNYGEVLSAIRRYVLAEERGLRGYTLEIELQGVLTQEAMLSGDHDGALEFVSAQVTATLTTEREQGEAG